MFPPIFAANTKIIYGNNFGAPFTKSINSSMDQTFFPDLAKTALIDPLDKGKPNENDISNFRPASILNTISKIYETVIKNNFFLAQKIFSLTQISGYRENYNLQHVLIRLIEEC